jgi:hypothetical protein
LRPDRNDRHAAPTRCRVQEPARGLGYHHPRRRLVFRVFAALAEFIRKLIVEGTGEDLDAARTRGVRLGRPSAMTAEQIRHAPDLVTRPDNTVSFIAWMLGVSRATIYKYIPEVTENGTFCGRATRPDPRPEDRRALRGYRREARSHAGL